MDANKEKALEAAGWRSGDAADFLGMTDAERQELDLRVALSRAVCERRKKLGLSQLDLAKRLKVNKRTIDKIEYGAGDITLEQMLGAYSALGGRLTIKELPPHSGNGANGSAKAGKKKVRGTT
jgi:ribosome-binding protein aMBF1 (putative translation factor)